VDYLVAPARISEALEAEAKRIALSVVEAMDFVGLLAVELFLDKEGRILVNEVAPRAHNSGHHTIEACGTSQFEQHLRAILGLPLGDTAQHSAAAMLNLIGGSGANGVPLYSGLAAAMAEPGLHPHLYGKAAVREGRKMGHVTVLATSSDAAEQRILALRDHISTVHAH
jgi:5-(carboxyamino)imidazole ribonucleotide synthase